jgi:DNA polymerase-3 subunit alpha
MVMPAADYSFNKSHAACYAYISYQTAYLKAHFPVEFHAALLRSVEQDTDKLAHFVDELSLRGIQVQ